MSPLPLSLQSLALAMSQPVTVTSTPTRAKDVAGHVWPVKKNVTPPVPPGKVVAVPGYDPGSPIGVRPAVMLSRLGSKTTPKLAGSALALATSWAWVRYFWAFAPPAAGSSLRLSDEAFALRLHHRQALSEDMGIALAFEAIRHVLCDGVPGARVDFIDVDVALDVGSAPTPIGGKQPGKAATSKSRPDYFVKLSTPGAPTEVFALECKGAHRHPMRERTMYKAASQLQGVTLTPMTGPTAGVASVPKGYVSATTITEHGLAVELLDPPGDEGWIGESAQRSRRQKPAPVLEERERGRVEVHEAAGFRRLLDDIQEAELLTLAGQTPQASARLASWPGHRRATAPPGPPESRREDDLGYLDGRTLSLPLEGGEVLNVFLGVERDTVQSVQADDDAVRERASTAWRERTGHSMTADRDDGALVVERDAGLTVALADGVVLQLSS